jgi:hypothetical protein
VRAPNNRTNYYQYYYSTICFDFLFLPPTTTTVFWVQLVFIPE